MLRGGRRLATSNSPSDSARPVSTNSDCDSERKKTGRDTVHLREVGFLRFGVLDIERGLWDYPTMSTTIADAKKRVVISPARPGDVFDIQKQAEGCFLLVRMERPEPAIPKSRQQCLRAIDASPLQPRMTWEQLRRLTRDS